MTERIIDNELRLIPYYRNDEASLPWYQDLDVWSCCIGCMIILPRTVTAII